MIWQALAPLVALAVALTVAFWRELAAVTLTVPARRARGTAARHGQHTGPEWWRDPASLRHAAGIYLAALVGTTGLITVWWWVL